MAMGFAPTWLRQVSPPLLHKTTLTVFQCWFPGKHRDMFCFLDTSLQKHQVAGSNYDSTWIPLQKPLFNAHSVA